MNSTFGFSCISLFIVFFGNELPCVLISGLKRYGHLLFRKIFFLFVKTDNKQNPYCNERDRYNQYDSQTHQE